MGVTLGLCAVCQAPGAIHSCTLCGRTVCAQHWRHGAGTCTMHQEGNPGPGRGGSPSRGRS
jgi:hypothetical protein